MEMSPDHAEHGMLARALDWIRAYAARQDELSHLSRDDIAAMATDLGMTEADLRDVMPRGADNTLLMDCMIQARGLDPEVVRRSLTPLMRELELTCTRCTSTARCRRELAAGTAAARCHEFCHNADVMDDLLASQDAD